MEMLEGIMTTRAMRRFTAEPVPDGDIETCIRAAVQGPSGGNIQPWQFLVVKDADRRVAIGAVYERAYTRYEKAMLASMPPFRSEDDEASFNRTMEASRHLAAHLGAAPVHILVLMPALDMRLHDDDGPLDVGTPYASVYPAVQNLMLAARSLGLGTALTTVYRIYQADVRAVCDIPDRFEIVALVPLGHPTGTFGVARRRPADRITHWDTFANRRDF